MDPLQFVTLLILAASVILNGLTFQMHNRLRSQLERRLERLETRLRHATIIVDRTAPEAAAE